MRPVKIYLTLIGAYENGLHKVILIIEFFFYKKIEKNELFKNFILV